MISRSVLASARLRAAYGWVRSSLRSRTVAMRHRASLAWRSPPRQCRCRTTRPEEASIGLAPRRAATDVSLRSRSGLSPAAISSAAATWGPTPGAGGSAGAAWPHRRAISASSSLISALSDRWRLARTRSALRVPARASPRLSSGRSLEQALTRSAVRRPRSRPATCSADVTSSPLSWLAATVRALTAERRAAHSTRIASTGPSADFGQPVASPDSTAPRCRHGIGRVVLVAAPTPACGDAAPRLRRRPRRRESATGQRRSCWCLPRRHGPRRQRRAAMPTAAGSRRPSPGTTPSQARGPPRLTQRQCAGRGACPGPPTTRFSSGIIGWPSLANPTDRAPPAGTTDSAFKALEPTLPSGRIRSNRLVRAPRHDAGRQIVCKARSQRSTESDPHRSETHLPA